MVLTTGERLAIVETEIKNVNDSIKKMDTKLDEFIKSADKKYASKLAERIVYSLCALILVAFVTKLLQFW